MAEPGRGCNEIGITPGDGGVAAFAYPAGRGLRRRRRSELHPDAVTHAGANCYADLRADTYPHFRADVAANLHADADSHIDVNSYPYADSQPDAYAGPHVNTNPGANTYTYTCANFGPGD